MGLLDRDEGSDGAGESAALLCEGGLCFRFLVGGALFAGECSRGKSIREVNVNPNLVFALSIHSPSCPVLYGTSFRFDSLSTCLHIDVASVASKR